MTSTCRNVPAFYEWCCTATTDVEQKQGSTDPYKKSLAVKAGLVWQQQALLQLLNQKAVASCYAFHADS